MLEYFLSPAKADLLPTDGGSSAHSDPLVTGLFYPALSRHIWQYEWFLALWRLITEYYYITLSFHMFTTVKSFP